MPKKYRLSHADFTRLPRSGRRIHGVFFSLTATPLAPGTGVKAACVISKKTAARAVDRNKVERRCREALRPLLKAVAKPVALVFHAKREALGASFKDIARDIKGLVERAV